MILVCGATGMLGMRIVTRLRERGHPVRALVRPATDATALETMGVEIIRGDLRDHPSLAPAVEGATAVVSTVNTIARVMEGERSLKIGDVDERGHAALIDAAERAGVQRFVFLSFLDAVLRSGTPFSRAKIATERRLRSSPIREVVVKPDMFQEVWLTELVQFDWMSGKVTIMGKGRAAHRYVAVDDVAAVVVHALLAEDPPATIEFGGPEAMTRVQAAEAFERATGRAIKRSHVPRAALRIGSIVLRPVHPVMASLMGQSLVTDSQDSSVTDEAIRELGITPRPASRYITETVSAGDQTTPAS